MTVESLCRRITNFGFALLEAEFAIDARSHVVGNLSKTRKTIIWARDDRNSLMTGSPSRIADYISVITQQEYSYLMRDGSAIQIAFTFDDGAIARHRLAFYPCPFPITQDDLAKFDGGLLDLIQDAFLDQGEQNVLLRSPIRFDYDPSVAADFHPSSHMTVNDPSCRIPARTPLQFDTFMKFILENFYIDAWRAPAVHRELVFAMESECFSAHDKGRAYLNWAYPQSSASFGKGIEKAKSLFRRRPR